MDELSLVTNLPSAIHIILLVVEALERRENSRSIHLYFTEHVGASIFKNKVNRIQRLDDAPPLEGGRLAFQQEGIDDLASLVHRMCSICEGVHFVVCYGPSIITANLNKDLINLVLRSIACIRFGHASLHR